MTTITMTTKPRAETGALSVERVSGMDYDTFVREHLIPRRPVILTDATREWKALSRWTPQFFKEKYGAKEVTISLSGKTYIIGEVMDRLASSDPEHPAPYLHNMDIARMFPELIPDVHPRIKYTLPNWMEGWYPPGPLKDKMQRLTPVEVYIGGAGAQFPILHYDVHFTHAFLSQIYGEKEYIFYAPDQTPYLYSEGGTSPVNVLNPDLEKFPLFAQADPIKLILRPGETLLVPAGWWHTARMLSPSITLSINIANSSNWTDFVEDVTRGRNPIVAGGLKAYLKAYGLARSLSRS
jgi:histone arginine demethylase JMJD6